MLRFHRRIQHDLDSAPEQYFSVSEALAEDFFAEFNRSVSKIESNPKAYHFDECGLRRVNFERFPFNLLFDVKGGRVRIWVLRHHSRRPSFGTRRFK